MTWSIGLYSGDLKNLHQHNDDPILKITDFDFKTWLTADPFIITENKNFYLFFEIIRESKQIGEIAIAKSTDGFNWKFSDIIISEKYHMSYPHVIKYNDEYLMTPSSKTQNFMIYKAIDFPYKWKKIKTFDIGTASDNMISNIYNNWWLWLNHNNKVKIFEFNLDSPKPTQNTAPGRPAGRIQWYNGNPIRLSQIHLGNYGTAVIGHQITKINQKEYQEIPFNNHQWIIGANNHYWSNCGMHHLDHFKKDNIDYYIVDGNSNDKSLRSNLWKIKGSPKKPNVNNNR